MFNETINQLIRCDNYCLNTPKYVFSNFFVTRTPNYNVQTTLNYE